MGQGQVFKQSLFFSQSTHVSVVCTKYQILVSPFATVTESAVAIVTDPEKFDSVSVRHCDW